MGGGVESILDLFGDGLLQWGGRGRLGEVEGDEVAVRMEYLDVLTCPIT